MLRFGFVALAVFIGFLLPVVDCNGQDQVPAIRTMSFNIRYGTANDGINRWDVRKEFLIETIQAYSPDLLGTQETLASQRDYLYEKLHGYGVVGVGRDDGKLKGEMAALFYRTDRFEELEQGHFWLSPTPLEVGSKGWDAALPRIASWVKLRDRRDPNASPILFLNAHLDHQGKMARAESTSLIRSKLQELGRECRWIITGDFNADPNDSPYANLFGQKEIDGRNIRDTYRMFRSVVEQAEGTFSSFVESNRNGSRIDWIGCTDEFDVRVAGIDRTARDGRTPSDHFPVFATLRPRSSSSTYSASASSTSSSSTDLRILTYNIHHGEGTDGKTSLERIAKVIRDADADLVALQEVDQGVSRSGSVSQMEAIAAMTGYYAVFAKAIDFGGGEYGQAILSRWPIADKKTIELTQREGRENRIAISADVLSEFGKLRFVGTHFEHAQADLRQAQALFLAKQLESELSGSNSPELCVLAGDLNDTPESMTLAQFQDWHRDPAVNNAGDSLASFPSSAPQTRIDYVMLPPSTPWILQACEVIPEEIASDHRPVLTVIRRKQ